MEYKRLSEVDMGTANDSTNVIAEVNGEIKRVPKSEVGGAGGYIMTLTADNFNSSTKVCTENYDEMYDVLMARGSVWIYDEIESVSYLCLRWQIASNGLVMHIVNDDIIFTNGSHNPETPSEGVTR